ncbi:MAG: bifunctional UDP-N-acetylglucosamine diphosphorylase/glucosamine-1-phosphate N-acetyltransferase GlmU [Thermodesulfovibrionaceae bacterium]
MEVLVLAAGLGTRMRSSKPKILHKLFDKTIIDYVIETANSLNPEKVFIVVNPDVPEVLEHLKNYELDIIFQEEPKGTAHAVSVAIPYLKSEKILIINGDTPLIKEDTIFKFIDIFEREKIDLGILSFYPEREHSYGRILRDTEGRIIKILEATEIKEYQNLRESNSGVYLIKRYLLDFVQEIKENPRKKEFYFTDIVEILSQRGYKIQAYPIATEEELIGINNRNELSIAMAYLRDRFVKSFMEKGVTFYDPKSVWLSPLVKIGQDTIIYPGVWLEGNTTIGSNCVIYSSVRIKNSIVEDNVEIKDCTVVENSYIKSGSKIGPFAHIRPETVIGKNCRIGNFVEVKKSTIGDGTKAAHLSYIGDAEVGSNVNIGAGTITCNYDGKKKNKTVIEDDVFVGSDTQLIAPVKIGKGAYIGAGSTITKDVPSDALAVSRTPQKNIEGWAKRRRQKS